MSTAGRPFRSARLSVSWGFFFRVKSGARVPGDRTMEDLLCSEARNWLYRAYPSNGLTRALGVLLLTTLGVRSLPAVQSDTLPKPNTPLAVGQIMGLNVLINRFDAVVRH